MGNPILFGGGNFRTRFVGHSLIVCSISDIRTKSQIGRIFAPGFALDRGGRGIGGGSIYVEEYVRRVGLMGFVGKSGGSHYEHTLLKMASPVIMICD